MHMAYTPIEDIAAREDGLVLPRRLGNSPASEGNISLARSWIKICGENHSSCRLSTSRPLPTRVLDLGTKTQTKDVFLYISDIHETGEYAALSYVWGSRLPLRTTMANLETHRKGIGIDQLPKTFRDAVTVARFLGIQYLWIDALCIIQDNPEDWAVHCVGMRNIFKNSYVTIAAADSPNADTGFLNDRAPKVQVKTCRIPYIDSGDNVAGTMSLRLSTRGNELHTSEVVPLTTRAWVLQEKLLSNRILYYGDLQMYWDCNTASYHESKGIFNTRKGRNRIKDELQSDRCDVKTWYWLIEDYTARNLTIAQDKLPALSGLAQEFQRKTGFSYVAGLWKEDLFRGLTWEMSRAEGAVVRRKPTVYCGPSWSWCSTDGDVFFEKDYTLVPHATVIDINIEIEHVMDPFGRLRSAELMLFGRLKKAVARSRLDGGKVEWSLSGNSPEEEQIGRCNFDDVTYETNTPPDLDRPIWCFLLGDISNSRNNTSTPSTEPIPAAALLLTPHGDGWQRVGYAVVYGELVHADGGVKSRHGKEWFNDGMLERVRIY